MKLFLDDVREEPEGWIKVDTPEKAIKVLKMGHVTEISLDHDLGLPEPDNGYKVLLWIEEQVATNGMKPPLMKVHSSNWGARHKMEHAITQIWFLYYKMEKKNEDI